jgi:transcriptional regulator with XRE-family HTH domain
MPPTLGQRLRHAREERGLKIEDISHKTRIAVPRLRELEEGNVNGCGSITYARSFLKIYSNFLKVDASEVLERMHPPPLGGSRDYRYLTEDMGHWVDDSRTPAMVPPHPRKASGRSFGWAAIVGLLILGLGVGLYWKHAL